MLRRFSFQVHTLIVTLSATLMVASYVLSYRADPEDYLEWRMPVFSGFGLAYAMGCAFYLDAFRKGRDDRQGLYFWGGIGVAIGNLGGWVFGSSLLALAHFGAFRAFLAGTTVTGAYMLLRTVAHLWRPDTKQFRQPLR